MKLDVQVWKTWFFRFRHGFCLLMNTSSIYVLYIQNDAAKSEHDTTTKVKSANV